MMGWDTSMIGPGTFQPPMMGMGGPDAGFMAGMPGMP